MTPQLVSPAVPGKSTRIPISTRLFVKVAVFDYGIVEMTVMLDGRLVWTAETQGTTN